MVCLLVFVAMHRVRGKQVKVKSVINVILVGFIKGLLRHEEDTERERENCIDSQENSV